MKTCIQLGQVCCLAIGLLPLAIISARATADVSTARTAQPTEHMDEAKGWLKSAYDDACKIAPDDVTENMDLLAFVGGAQANAGDVPGAIKTAGQLIERASRAHARPVSAFERIAAISILINVGETARAKSLIDAFEAEVAQKLASGKLEASDFDMKWTAGAIAVQRVRLGDVEAAKALISKISNPGNRALSRCQLAEILYAVNKRDVAAKMLHLAREESLSPDSTAGIAVEHKTYHILVRAGEFDAACKFYTPEADSNGVIYEIVSALFEVHEFGPHDTDLALTRSMCEKMEKLPDADFKTVHNYMELAAAQAFDANDFEGALRTIRRGEPKLAALKPGDRKEMLIQAAAVEARAGDLNAYYRTFAAAEKITDLASRYGSDEQTEDHLKFAYFDVAHALAASRKFDDALQMAERCPRTIIKFQIAAEMARAGQLDRAIEQLKGQRLLLERFRPFAWACVESGRDLAPLKHWTSAIDDAERRGTLELAAAEALMNKRDSLPHIAPPW